MNPIIHLQTFPNYYFFYCLAFAAVTGILIREGKIRKYPMIPWLLFMTTGFLFFVVGTKLLVFSSTDWDQVLSQQPLNHPAGSALIGGIAFGFLGLLIARYFLKFDARALDAYALVIPVGMCIQRFGCLLAGCCFGTPSDLPWAIRYDSHTSVFQYHVHSGVIPADALTSLSIHPVQIYESIGCILMVILLIMTRNRFKAAGNTLLMSGLCYYILRFALGFFREDAANAFGEKVWQGLPVIQWIFLVLIILSIVVIAFRERMASIDSDRNILWRLTAREVLYFFVLAIGFALTSTWLSKAEILAIYLAFLPITALLIVRLFTTLTTPAFRLATLGMMACSVVFMAQVSPEQENVTTVKKANPVVETFNEISGGFVFGSSDLNKKTGEIPVSSGGDGGCNGSGATSIPLYTDFNLDYSSGSAGFARTWVGENGNKMKIGINGTAGTITEKIYSDYQFESKSRVNFWSVNPYVKYDTRAIGVTAGFLAGDLYQINPSIDDDDFNGVMPGDKPTSLKHSSIYPQIGLRIGRLNSFFIESGYNDQAPSPLPANVFKFGIGYGFKSNSGFYLTMGSSSFNSIYFTSHITIDRRVTLEPYIGFGQGLNSFDDGSGTMGSLNLSMRLGQINRN